MGLDSSDGVEVKSKKTAVIVAIAIVASLLVVVGAIIIFAFSSTQREDAQVSSDSSEQQEQAIATTDTVRQNISDLKTAVGTAKTDQEAAKAALKDGEKQIRVDQ